MTKISSTLSLVLISLFGVILAAKGADLDKRDVKECLDYKLTKGQEAASHLNWSALTYLKPSNAWNKRYNEYSFLHDAKGQYVRFAAESNNIANGNGYRHLAFSNRTFRRKDASQKEATYRYNVHLKDGGIRMFILNAGQKCLNNGVNVDFLSSNIQDVSIDILND